MIVPCKPAPLYGAVSISIDLAVGNSFGWSEEEDLQLFGSRREEEVYKARITAAVGAQLRAAGYAVETDSRGWETEDRGKYENTGVPHHTLFITVGGEGFRHEDCESIFYVFYVSIGLLAEFLTPDESVETYSRERTNYASESDIETEILEVVSAIVADLQNTGGFRCPAPRKETLHFNDGQHSLDLRPQDAL